MFNAQTLQMINTWVIRSLIIGSLILFLIYLLIGVLKGWKKTGVRLAFLGITVLISMLFTVLISKILEPTVQNLAINLVNQNLSDASNIVNEAITSAPTLISYVYALLSALISPLIFVIVFLILCLIMKIPAHIINKLVLRLTEGKADNQLLNRLVGGALGLVCAFSVISCLYMPITGYVNTANELYLTLKEENVITTSDSDDEIMATINQVNDSKMFRFQSNVSKPLFNSVAKIRTDYETQGINEEISRLILIYKKGLVVAKNDYSNIKNINTEDITALIDVATESQLYSQIFAEILSSASTKWTNNEAFLGFNLKETVGSDLAPCIDIVLNDFTETNKDEVADDIRTLATTFDVLIEMVNSVEGLQISDATNIDTSKLKETIAIIDSNEKLKEIVASLLSNGAGKWSKGETFVGVNATENVPQEFQGALRVAFAELETTSKDTICADLLAFCDAIDILGDFSKSITALDFTDYKSFSTEELDGFIEVMDSNDLLKKVVAEILNDAGTAWGDTPPRDFFGVNIKESMPEGFKNALDKNINDFKTTNERTVISDLTRFSDTIKAYKYAISLADEGASIDELESNMQNFVNAINENNVDILKDTITDEMLMGSGIAVENLPIVSDVLSSTIQNISTLDDSDKSKEAEALNKLLAYSKDRQSGGDSSVPVTEEEMVDSIINSNAVSNAVITYSQYSTGVIQATPEEKESIANALAKYGSSTDQSVIDKTQAIEKLFGLNK